jgi:hypothetical protein
MSTEAITPEVRKILRRDAKAHGGAISPEKLLILTAVLGRRAANRIAKQCSQQ